jgi:O-antigen/teichoic acid export membrane protein
MLWTLRDRPDIGGAHRAWVRGSINGWLGRPPADLSTDPEVRTVGSDPPTSAEFRRSLSWRLLAAPIGTLATFVLTAIAARRLTPADLTVFYALLAALMIGPILGRFGLNQWAVKDLASLRTRDDVEAAVALGRRYVISAVAPAALAAPIISGLFIAGISQGRLDLSLTLLAAVILFAETWRLAIGDVLIGLGQTGWSAVLGHQVRAIVVTLAVLSVQLIAPDALDLNRILGMMALVAVGLVVGGLHRLWTLPARQTSGQIALHVPELLRRGYPFLVVDLIVVVVARGDVWLAGPALTDETAARYGTASILGAQIGVPIGLASVALAPVVAGLFAQRKLEAVERAVRSVATLVGYALIPVLVASFFFGESLLAWVYGPLYVDAHPYLLVLMIGNLALAVLGAGPVVLLMSGRQRETMVVCVSWFAVAAPTAVIAAIVGGAMALAVASAMTTIGLYLLLAFTTWTLTGIRLLPYLDPRHLQLPTKRLRDGVLVGSAVGRDTVR